MPIDQVSPYDLLDTDETCRLIGGTRPISRTTLWRGVKSGRYPPPVKVGPNSARWVRAEVLAVIARAAAARDGTKAEAA